MSRRGFLGIEMEFDLFQPEACPADHVFSIPWMKGPRREEALARFEVAATQKKAKLIGGRTQVRGGLLDCLGEIKYCLRWKLLNTGADSKASCSTVLRIFIRGMGGLLSRSCRNWREPSTIPARKDPLIH